MVQPSPRRETIRQGHPLSVVNNPSTPKSALEEKRFLAVAGRDVIGSGGGSVLVNTVREFVKRGHEVVVVSDYDLSSVLPPGVPQRIMPLGASLRRWSPTIKVFKTLRQFFRLVLFSIYGRRQLAKLEREGWISIDHNLEAFGANISVMHNVFIADFAKRKNYARFISPGTIFCFLRERFVQKMKYVHAVVAVSRGTLAEAVRHYAHRPDQVLSYVFNGVDIGRFSPFTKESRASFLSRQGLNPNDFFLLFVGHEFKRKGVPYVLEAMPRLPSNVKFLVVGGREENIDVFISRAEALGVGNRVLFLGTRRDVADFYAACDAFVFPSHYEACPMVVLEAMASGAVVFSARVSGVEDYLVEGENGFFIQMSGEDIAAKIMTLMENAPLMERVKKQARETAMKFTWEACAEGYLSIVRQLSSKKSMETT